MERGIKSLLKIYRRKVEYLVGQWNALEASQRQVRPAPGKWSLTETLVHLEMVQEACLMSMRERLESGIKRPSSLKHRWRFFKLRLAMWSHLKFKAPGMVQPPTDEAALKQWEPNAWLRSLDAIELFYKDLPSDYRQILLFKHPVAGPMKARHGLIFLIDHLEHHRRGMLR